jgi:hypothetical protein
MSCGSSNTDKVTLTKQQQTALGSTGRLVVTSDIAAVCDGVSNMLGTDAVKIITVTTKQQIKQISVKHSKYLPGEVRK